MVKTTRGKKLIDIRSLIIFYVLFIVIYVCLLFFTGPFLMTWGAERTFFERIYAWFLTRPFYSAQGLWTILIDAIFGATAIFAVFVLVRWIKKT
jgi:hypothetical protein